MYWGFSVICFLTEICMTSITISTCWPTFCTTWAQPSIRSSTIWCQPPIGRSSSPHYAPSASPAAIHAGGNPTRSLVTLSASPVTTPSPPTWSKRQHTDWRLFKQADPVLVSLLRLHWHHCDFICATHFIMSVVYCVWVFFIVHMFFMQHEKNY